MGRHPWSVLLFAPALWAQSVTFHDGDFASGWTEYRFSEKTSPGTTSRATKLTAGGNPGAFLRVDVEIPAGEETGAVTHALVLIRESATYSPARQGPIINLIYREEAKNLGSGGAPGDGQSTGLALRQNGKIWVIRALKTFKPADWLPASRTDFALNSGVFAQLGTSGPFFNTSVPGPDLSEFGADIQFGFWRGLELNGGTSGGGGGGYTPGGFSRPPAATSATSTSIGIDNWSVAVESLRAVDDRTDSTIDSSGNVKILLSEITANDGFPAGSTVRLDSTGGRGTATLDSAAVILYRPAVAGTGSDVVAYTIVTPFGRVSNQASITIHYRPAELACIVRPRNAICLEPFTPCRPRTIFVTKGGSPIAGALVWTGVTATTTGPDGTASLGVLRGAQFSVGVWQPGADIATAPEALCEGGTFTLAGLIRTLFQCPSSVIADNSTSDSDSLGNTLRALRDRRLGATARGRRLTDAYYAFAGEVKGILARDPKLLAGLAAQLLEHRELAGRIAAGESVSVPGEALEEASRIADRLAAHASPGLRAAITSFQRDLRDPVALADLGLRTPDPARTPREPARLLAALPLHFEPNRGQSTADVEFTARGSHDRLEITRTGPRVELGEAGSLSIRLASAGAAPIQADAAPRGHSNYMKGSRRSDWRMAVPHYTRLRQRNVHPGIDLVYYGSGGRLEFDFEIAPGGDPAAIRLRVDGASRLETNADGDLILHRGAASATLHRPSVYQWIGERREPVAARYVARGNEVEFALGPRDRSARLVIDPVLTYAGYLGGSGADAALAVAVDAQGNTYLTGATGSPDFLTKSPIRGRSGSGEQPDAFVTKLDTAGALVYSTYFGGSSDDVGLGIVVDAQGAAYVTGATRSADFPVAQALQRNFGGAGRQFGTDAFALKLDPTGTAVVYSTYLGGSGDDAARGIAVDRSGNAYIAGATASPNFPLANAAYATHRGGEALGLDGFVAKINPTGSALVYSTLLGGGGDDFATAIAVDPAGAAHVTGGTASDDFPAVNPLQRARAGEFDAFAASLNPAGGALTYSTFLGGSSFDIGLAIALDARGGAHIGGATGSLDSFPLFKPSQAAPGSRDSTGVDSFVTRLEPGGGRFVYSTLLGGNGLDVIVSLALDDAGNAYAGGFTSSTGFASGPALQAARGGSTDGLLAKLTPNGAVEYRGYFGGSSVDAIAGLAVDGRRGLVVAGSSSSTDGPVTGGAILTGPKGTSAAMVARIGPADGVPLLRAVSNASFEGESGIAPDSRASLTGFGALATDGLTIRVADLDAEIVATAPDRIDFVVPGAVNTGIAEIVVSRGGERIASTRIQVARVAPAIYTESGDGTGLVSGFLEESGGERFLVVLATGMRAGETRAASIGGTPVPVASIEPYAGNPGIDLARLGPLSAEVTDKGEAALRMTIDGKRSNEVLVRTR